MADPRADGPMPEPSCVPLEKRAELLEFARALESGSHQLETAHCDCGYHYVTGYGGYPSCPRCNEHPPSLNDLLNERECWPGHGFVWDESRRMRGCWVPAQDTVCLSREGLRRVAELLPDDSCEWVFDVAIERELTRLRSIITEADLPNIERAEREAKRASQLADECGRLKAELDRKRIECDELRDGPPSHDWGPDKRVALSEGGFFFRSTCRTCGQHTGNCAYACPGKRHG
jgi:hypothetical protein